MEKEWVVHSYGNISVKKIKKKTSGWEKKEFGKKWIAWGPLMPKC